jgi:hypothetical protein
MNLSQVLLFKAKQEQSKIHTAWIPRSEIDFVRACQDADKRAKKAIKEAK